MKNWKTTLSAAITAIAAFVSSFPHHFGGEGSLQVDLSKFVVAGGLFAFGLNAKDN